MYITFSLQVRDGADETSPFVGRYCGTGIPPVLRSSGYSFWIKFKADGSNQGSGFRATWEVGKLSINYYEILKDGYKHISQNILSSMVFS